MGLGNISECLEEFIKETGSMMKCAEKESNPGPMAVLITVVSKMELKMDLEYTPGQMAAFSLVNGRRIESRVKGSTSTRTEDSISVHGKCLVIQEK